MSDYVKDIFLRADLRQVLSFILYGVDNPDATNEPYKARLKHGESAIYKRLETAYPNRTHLDEAHADLSQALSAYESVYTEIGMKAGAKILYQLLVAEQ